MIFVPEGYYWSYKDTIQRGIFWETGKEDTEKLQDEPCKTIPDRLQETRWCRWKTKKKLGSVDPSECIIGFFDEAAPQTSASLVKVNPASEFCIKYDPTQVTDWDQQTGTTYAGYSPNPSTFHSILVQAETKYFSLFADVINKGKCWLFDLNRSNSLIKSKRSVSKGLWSSGYDVALTQRRPPVQIRPSPFKNVSKSYFLNYK